MELFASLNPKDKAGRQSQFYCPFFQTTHCQDSSSAREQAAPAYRSNRAIAQS
jgi:hypothetical protein